MTDQREPREPETSHGDIRFLAERAGEAADVSPGDAPRPLGDDKGEALMVLLTALSSNARFNQHHDHERAELIASIRR
jgi:hypothetical protein